MQSQQPAIPLHYSEATAIELQLKDLLKDTGIMTLAIKDEANHTCYLHLNIYAPTYQGEIQLAQSLIGMLHGENVANITPLQRIESDDSRFPPHYGTNLEFTTNDMNRIHQAIANAGALIAKSKEDNTQAHKLLFPLLNNSRSKLGMRHSTISFIPERTDVTRASWNLTDASNRQIATLKRLEDAGAITSEKAWLDVSDPQSWAQLMITVRDLAKLKAGLAEEPSPSMEPQR